MRIFILKPMARYSIIVLAIIALLLILFANYHKSKPTPFREYDTIRIDTSSWTRIDSPAINLKKPAKKHKHHRTHKRYKAQVQALSIMREIDSLTITLLEDSIGILNHQIDSLSEELHQLYSNQWEPYNSWQEAKPDINILRGYWQFIPSEYRLITLDSNDTLYLFGRNKGNISSSPYYESDSIYSGLDSALIRPDTAILQSYPNNWSPSDSSGKTSRIPTTIRNTSLYYRASLRHYCGNVWIYTSDSITIDCVGSK